MSTSLRNLGKFKLQECIGKVGRVETWKAVDPSFRRYVTIKIFHDDQEQKNDPNFIPRFEHEARVLRTLQHSNRSEEHTSELQSRLHLVCRLLLEKKKKKENSLI